MSTTVDVKTGEIVDETALVPTKVTVSQMVKEQDQPILAMAEQLDSLDWSKLKPHQAALLLMTKPFMVSGGGTMFLTFKQALLFAVRSYELGLSPFGTELWFDASRGSVNLTTEGRKALARNKGLDLGPPQFEEMYRKWEDCPKMSPLIDDLKKQGFTKDIGIKCKIRVGDRQPSEYAEYLCWLSEWAVPRSPVWQAKPLHMLQVRATDKCLSMAMGTGLSEMISDE